MSVDMRSLRMCANKTQREVAEECGVSLRTYIRWEHGKSDDIPHGRYVHLVAYLEETIRFRKEVTMAKEFGRTEVEFDEPNDDGFEAGEFTVKIPDGLQEEFQPSKPVSDQEMLAWATKHKEPYPGFADEFEAWDSAWAEVASRQREQDTGKDDLRVESVHPQPEEDGEGNQYLYDNEAVINEINDPRDPENGDENAFIPQDTEGNDLPLPERSEEEK